MVIKFIAIKLVKLKQTWTKIFNSMWKEETMQEVYDRTSNLKE